MEIIKQQIDELNALVSIKITESDYAPLVKKELNKARQSAQIKGFRQGMVPIDLLKKMYGQEILVKELNALMSESLNKFVLEERGNLIGEPIPSEEKQPEINWADQKDFEFVYEIGYFPELNLKLDDSISAPFYKIIVTDESIDEQVNTYCKRNGQSEKKDISESNDILKIQVTGTLGEEAFDEEAQLLIKTLPEEQQAQFLNRKPCEELEVDMKATFPNETDLASMLKISKEQLALLPTTLHFKINEIARWKASELNQTLFDNVLGAGIVHSDEEFREKLKEQARQYYEQRSMRRLSFDVQKILFDNAKMELPTDFIKRFLLFSNEGDAINTAAIENLLETDLPYITKSIGIRYINQCILDQYGITIENHEVVEMAQQKIYNTLRGIGLEDFSGIDIETILKRSLSDKNEVSKIHEEISAYRVAELVAENAHLDEIDITLEDFNILCQAEISSPLAKLDELIDDNKEISDEAVVEIIENRPEVNE